MPFITREQLCADIDPHDISGCLERAEREDMSFLVNLSGLKEFCQTESTRACELGRTCDASSNGIDFGMCLVLAESQAREERAETLLWIVAAAVAIALAIGFWWRRPLGRALRRAAAKFTSVGAP